MLVVGTLEQFYRPFLAYDGAGAEHTRRLPCPRQSRGDFRLDRIHQQATADRGSRRNRCIEPINTHPRVADGCAGVTAGGLTDRLLSDDPNMFGDTSAGSGLNALTRDPDHAREFLARQQDKLLFGSDCDDTIGEGAKCQGAQILAALRELSPNKAVERKILYGNANKLLRLPAWVKA